MDEKAALRSRLRAARAARSPGDLADAARDLARIGMHLCRDVRTVAAYASVRDEPPTHELLDTLASRGVTILLPVVCPGGLDWAEYDGWPALVERKRLLEPAGELRGPTAVHAADIVLAPALAVDRRGNRLGRGGGHYDRALVAVPRDRIVALVFTDEVLDAIPGHAHDVPVRAALTPAGVIELGEQTFAS